MTTSLQYRIDGGTDALELVARLVARSERPPAAYMEIHTTRPELVRLITARALENNFTVETVEGASLITLDYLPVDQLGRLRELVGPEPSRTEWGVGIWNESHDWCGGVMLFSHCTPPWQRVPGRQALVPGRLTLELKVVCERQWDGEVDLMRAWLSKLTGAAMERVGLLGTPE